jgi:hypothetical protein
VPIHESLQRKITRTEVHAPRGQTIDLEGLHFASFSSDGRDLVNRHVQFVKHHMPELSKEFVKNILNTSFIEWERINKVNIESVLRIKDPEELRNQMDQLWEIFRRNIDKFIVIPEQKLKLEKIRDDFFRTFENF